MKTPKSTIVLAVLLIFTLSGCTFTSSFLNREQDKKDAEKVINKFYEVIKNKKYEAVHGGEVYDLFSVEFWRVTSVKKMVEIFTATQNKLGDLLTTDISQWETKVTTGTNPASRYAFEYKNHHQKYDSVETFVLSKGDDGKIRIDSYNINSEGFFK